MAAELNIKVSAEGTEVTTNSGSVADAAETGRLVGATALPVRLLDQAVIDRFVNKKDQGRILVVSVGKRGINFVNGNSEAIRQLQDVLSLLHNSVIEFYTGKPHFLNLTLRQLGEPCVWVPSSVDGLEDLPKKVPVRTAPAPCAYWRKDPPDWFIEGCKKLFPNAGWDGEISDAETAITCFASYALLESFLDHWGWCEQESGEDILVSEPYGLRESGTRALVEVCQKAGWTWNIKGLSSHAPSATLRIEIHPRSR